MDDIELKIRAIEEIEFEMIMAQKTGNSSLVAGLERAIEIIEEVANG